MSSIEFNTQGDILCAWLNTPGVGNALSLEMISTLVDKLEKEVPGALLLSHRGPHFCAGGNLRHYQKLEKAKEGRELNQKIREQLQKLSTMPLLRLCLVDGLCLGGGVELASCFHGIWAKPTALFGLWQRRMGLTVGWGGETRLRQRLSESVFQKWLISGETRHAYACRDLGLVDRIVVGSGTYAQALAWLQGCLQLGSEELKEHLGENLSYEALFAKLWMGPSHQRALEKFSSK